jgi:hypothetical protein
VLTPIEGPDCLSLPPSSQTEVLSSEIEMMRNIRVQPFSQYTNWFRLTFGDGAIYKMAVSMTDEEPVDYFMRHDGEYFSLKVEEGYQPVCPEDMLRRRIILHGFRDALTQNGFAFKGPHGYIAYWALKPYDQPHNDVFSAYTGFEYRVVEYEGDEGPECYLVIDPHVVFFMNMSVGDLVSRGISPSKLNNFSVKVLSEEGERVGGIDGFLVETQEGPGGEIWCRIIDVRTGTEEMIQASRAYLEPRPEIIRSVLQELGSSFDVVKFQREKSFLSSPFASKERFKKTQEIVRDYLVGQTQVFPLLIGEFRVDIDPDPIPVVGAGFPRARQLVEPALLFDKADSSAVHLQAYWGLRTFGPFTKDMPVIRLALLGTRSGVQILRDLVGQMNRGTRVMSGGMRQFFNTRLEVVDREVLASDTSESYIQGSEALGARGERRGDVDVVLVHLTKRTQDFELDTPYYNAKAILLRYGLPSQMVTPPALADPQWIHANLASAIFAKAGGWPWVLATDIPDFDMILGLELSAAISKTKRAGSRPRYIGYANVFDEQGRWMFFESTSQLYDFGKHQEQLADLVGIAVDRYEKVRGRRPYSIAIHYYKRFGEEEMELVTEVLRDKIGDHRTAFITVDKSHPMRLYDIQIRDGSFPRGHYAQLSDTEFLLSTTGHTELARKRLGTPEVLKVAVKQSPEPFVSIDSIASQVLALTRLNYKTLTPIVGEPVTLLFASLVASFTAVFSEYQWKEAKAKPSSKLDTVPWFL